MPDPTVRYASGLLTPEFGNSTKIGYFTRLPVYISPLAEPGHHGRADAVHAGRRRAGGGISQSLEQRRLVAAGQRRLQFRWRIVGKPRRADLRPSLRFGPPALSTSTGVPDSTSRPPATAPICASTTSRSSTAWSTTSSWKARPGVRASRFRVIISRACAPPTLPRKSPTSCPGWNSPTFRFARWRAAPCASTLMARPSGATISATTSA